MILPGRSAGPGHSALGRKQEEMGAKIAGFERGSCC